MTSSEHIKYLARMLDESTELVVEAFNLDSHLNGTPADPRFKKNVDKYRDSAQNDYKLFMICKWYVKEYAEKNGKVGDVFTNELKFRELMDKFGHYENLKRKIGADSVELQNDRNPDKPYAFMLKNNAGLQKVPSVERFAALVNKLVDACDRLESTGAGFDEQFAMTDSDRKNIKLVRNSDDMVCFATKTYESTNKFVYAIWRSPNMDTDSFGNGESDDACKKNSPFCTRMKKHWVGYSHKYPEYTQFWIFKTPGGPIETGDLTDPVVQKTLDALTGRGYELLIGLVDTFNDCNNRYDADTSVPNLVMFDKNGVDFS